MARHGFGRGEYKYFAYPLPDLVAELRTALYPPLRRSPIAGTSRWASMCAIPTGMGTSSNAATCRAVRPTPLLLQYGAGDFNCLHQDLYGDTFSAPVGDPAVGAGARFHRRRVRADRAAATDAVAARGRAAQPRRRRGLRGAHRPVQGTRGVSRQSAPWRQPVSLRPSPHPGRDLPRREMMAEPELTLIYSKPFGCAPSRSAFAEGAAASRLCAAGEPAGRGARASWRGAVSPHDHARRPPHVGRDDQLRQAGWLTDRSGYRYDAIDPEGRPWPAMPECLAHLAARGRARRASTGSRPTRASSTVTSPARRLTLHQDRNEQDFAAPIVSVSLGLPAIFLLGGVTRAVKPRRFRLDHGDVVVWGGPARLNFHGIDTLAEADHAAEAGSAST